MRDLFERGNLSPWIVFALAGILIDSSRVNAADWPQWMGPDRNNVWSEDGIIAAFPEQGANIVWRVPIAGGYSGASVADGRVFLMDYVTAENVKVANFERAEFTGVERVSCFNRDTGELIWRHKYPVKYTMSYPAGPRCTPACDEDRVYTLGGEGNLVCFRAGDGELLWSRNLVADYETKTALWGYANHPLIDGDKLICIVGGEGSHAVAFNKHTGKELWRALSASEQGYSPPTLIQAGGRRQLILLTPDEVASVDPETGRKFWSVDYEATNGSIIMSPILAGDHLYVGGYSNKNLLLKLDRKIAAAKVVWRDLNRQAVSPVNVQPILAGRVLYGFDQDGTFVAVELPTGKRLWETTKPLGERPLRTGTAFIVRQADRYWLFTEQGDLIIAMLTPDGFKELSRTHVIQPTNVAFGRDVVWSAPAFANRCVFLRNDEECICVSLADPSTAKPDH